MFSREGINDYSFLWKNLYIIVDIEETLLYKSWKLVNSLPLNQNQKVQFSQRIINLQFQ